MDKIEKIRAEIEQLIKINKTKNGYPAGTLCAVRIEAYEKLLSFLDTLSEEPDKSLEEAAKEYATTHLRNNEFPTADSAFIAGAEWQKEKDDKELSEKIAAAYQLGLTGKEKLMMEEAADSAAIKAFPEKKSYSTVADRVVDYNAIDRKRYHDGFIAGAKWHEEQRMKELLGTILSNCKKGTKGTDRNRP